MANLLSLWIVSLSAISLIGLWILVRSGPQIALGVVVPLSLLIPVWVEVPFWGQPVGIQSAVSLIALIGLTLHSPRRIWSPLTALDLCLVMMFAVHVFSDLSADGLSLSIPVAAYGEWVLPFVAGRYAVHDEDSLRVVANSVLLVLIVLGVCGAIESVWGTNLFELCFGERPLDGTLRNAARLGFQRAYGTTLHPIFFGILVLMLLPWSIPYLNREVSGRWRTIGVIALLAGLLGVLSSVSRGPVIGLIAAVVFFVCLCRKRMIIPVAVLGSVAIALGVLFTDQVFHVVERLVREDQGRLVEVEGQLAHVTSSRTRLLLFNVYGKAASHAGLFGYGTTLTTSFPMNIPHLPTSRETLKRLPFVDNAYLLLTLRFGFLGVAAYGMLFVVGIWTAAGTRLQTTNAPLLQALSATLAGVAVILLTVWMSYDCGFAILWTLGILSGVVSWEKSRELR